MPSLMFSQGQCCEISKEGFMDLYGHTTMVGRQSTVRRFSRVCSINTKTRAINGAGIEPLWSRSRQGVDKHRRPIKIRAGWDGRVYCLEECRPTFFDAFNFVADFNQSLSYRDTTYYPIVDSSGKGYTQYSNAVDSDFVVFDVERANTEFYYSIAETNWGAYFNIGVILRFKDIDNYIRVRLYDYFGVSQGYTIEKIMGGEVTMLAVANHNTLPELRIRATDTILVTDTASNVIVSAPVPDGFQDATKFGLTNLTGNARYSLWFYCRDINQKAIMSVYDTTPSPIHVNEFADMDSVYLRQVRDWDASNAKPDSLSAGIGGALFAIPHLDLGQYAPGIKNYDPTGVVLHEFKSTERVIHTHVPSGAPEYAANWVAKFVKTQNPYTYIDEVFVPGVWVPDNIPPNFGHYTEGHFEKIVVTSTGIDYRYILGYPDSIIPAFSDHSYPVGVGVYIQSTSYGESTDWLRDPTSSGPDPYYKLWKSSADIKVVVNTTEWRNGVPYVNVGNPVWEWTNGGWTNELSDVPPTDWTIRDALNPWRMGRPKSLITDIRSAMSPIKKFEGLNTTSFAIEFQCTQYHAFPLNYITGTSSHDLWAYASSNPFPLLVYNNSRPVFFDYKHNGQPVEYLSYKFAKGDTPYFAIFATTPPIQFPVYQPGTPVWFRIYKGPRVVYEKLGMGGKIVATSNKFFYLANVSGINSTQFTTSPLDASMNPPPEYSQWMVSLDGTVRLPAVGMSAPPITAYTHRIGIEGESPLGMGKNLWAGGDMDCVKSSLIYAPSDVNVSF